MPFMVSISKALKTLVGLLPGGGTAVTIQITAPTGALATGQPIDITVKFITDYTATYIMKFYNASDSSTPLNPPADLNATAGVEFTCAKFNATLLPNTEYGISIQLKNPIPGVLVRANAVSVNASND